MKRILVPIDGSERSLLALEYVKESFSPSVFEIVLLMVHDNMSFSSRSDDDDKERIIDKLNRNLDAIEEILDRYSVTKVAEIGRPGKVVTDTAKAEKCEMIVITKSTKDSLINSIGSTASYILRHATVNVLVVQEHGLNKPEEYRGLIYHKSASLVNLRGQLSFKQSECMLPSVAGDCIYHVEVTRGRVRFVHRSYNEETMRWDLPPLNGQKEFYDIAEGDSVDIPINVENGKKADRITIGNKSMKTEAVFKYSISKALAESEAADESDTAAE